MDSHTLWSNRFEEILSAELIEERSRLPAKHLPGLNALPVAVACDRIRTEWERFFSPTKQSTELILQMAGNAHAHAQGKYPDTRSFLERCLAARFEPEKPAVPLCITGLNGIGKSSILSAVPRVLPPDGTVSVGAEYMPFPFIASSAVKVRRQTNSTSIVRVLGGPGFFSQGLRVDEVSNGCARHLYRVGTCIILLDELQFLTLSESAVTAVTRVVLEVSYLGIPFVFAANFSLCSRLIERLTPELRDRVFTSTRVVVPDLPDSDDWLSFMAELNLPVKEVFAFRFVDHARDLWNLSAAVKRDVCELLLKSYWREREKGNTVVAWDAVILTYDSADFSIFRRSIEQLIAYAAKGERPDANLLSPFKSEREAPYREELAKLKQMGRAYIVTRAALNQSERDALLSDGRKGGVMEGASDAGPSGKASTVGEGKSEEFLRNFRRVFHKRK